MKLLLVLLVISMPFPIALADATETPAYMKDAVITVKLKNGKEYTFSANTHAVVTRASSNKTKPPVVITQTKTVTVVKTVEVEKKSGMNRVRLMGGVGQDGMSIETGATSTRIKPNRSSVAGIGYDRSLDENWSVGAQVLTNGVGTLGVGLDF